MSVTGKACLPTFELVSDVNPISTAVLIISPDMSTNVEIFTTQKYEQVLQNQRDVTSIRSCSNARRIMTSLQASTLSESSSPPAHLTSTTGVTKVT